MCKTGFSILLCIIAIGTTVSMAQEEKDEPSKTGWFNSTELSLVVTEGNSNTDSFGFKNVLTRAWKRSKFILKFDSVRSNTSDDRYLLVEPGIIFLPGEAPTEYSTTIVTPEKELDVEKYFVQGRYSRQYGKTRTWDVGGSWDRNEDAGILNRYIVFGGIGNQWRDSEKLRFHTGYALSFTSRDEETPDPEKEDAFLGARLTMHVDWGISKSTRLDYQLTGNLNLEDISDYSLDSNGTLSVSINKLLSLAVSLQFLYNSEPALEDADVFARVETVDPDGEPGSGDEYYRTVSSGGAEFEIGEDRIRLEQLDTVIRTSLVIKF